MKITFILDDHEDKITPMKIAQALAEGTPQLSNKDLKEIIAYLSVYTKYHAGGSK